MMTLITLRYHSGSCYYNYNVGSINNGWRITSYCGEYGSSMTENKYDTKVKN